MDNNTSTNIALIQKVISAMSDGDGKTFLKLLSEDFKFEMMGNTPLSTKCDSKQAFIVYLGELSKHLESNINLKITRISANDQVVVTECDGQAKLKNGKPYNNQYAQIWTIEDGLVVALREYNDTQLIMDQFF